MLIKIIDVVVALVYLLLLFGFYLNLKKDFKQKATGYWKLLYTDTRFFLYNYAKLIVGLNNDWVRLLRLNVPVWVVNFALMAHFHLDISFWLGVIVLGSCMILLGYCQLEALYKRNKFVA